MALLTNDSGKMTLPARPDAADIRAQEAPKKAAQHSWPVGAPKKAHTIEVLNTLKARLHAQLDGDGDEANDAYTSPETRAIRADIRYRLAQVSEALARIDEGKYGLCVECTGTIGADRLVVQPFSTRCTGCQESHDRRYRRNGGASKY